MNPVSSCLVIRGPMLVPSGLIRCFDDSVLSLLRRPSSGDVILVDGKDHCGSDLAATHESAIASLAMVEMSTHGAFDGFPSPGPEKTHSVSLRVIQARLRSLSAKFTTDEERKCFAAGVLLLWDFLDDSHSISQTLEGVGRPRTADYWHAIMHRREPDAGNSAYWFRRVGVHPALQSLAEGLPEWLREFDAAAEVEALALSLIRQDVFDSSRMISLTTRALSEGAGSTED